MRQLWAVTKVTLNSSFGISALRWRYVHRRERLWEPILVLVGIGTAVAFFGYGAYRLCLAMASVGAALGQPELPLGLAAVTAQVLVLMMGFFFVVSSFYFSRDLPLLVPLPIKPGAVITAKFLTILVGEYVTISFVFWPAVLAYSRFAPFGLGKGLVTLLVFLMLPVLPLAITALAAMTLMRSINRRHRDLFFYAGSILFFGLFLFWQMSLGRLPESDLQGYLESIITARLGLVRVVASRFPPALWATAAVHGGVALEGLQGLLLTAASAAASVAVLRAAGERLFYRGLIGGEEVARGRAGRAGRRSPTGARTASRDAGWTGLLARPRTPLRALVAREWALVLRTPVWVMNNLLPGIIVPLFMFVPIMATGKLQTDLGRLLAVPQGATIAGLILAGLLLFVGSVSGLAATALSREGPRLWISRSMPQSARLQAQAKLAMAMTVVVISAVPSVALFAVVLRLPALYLALPAMAGMLGSLATMSVGLRVDMARPMLRWKDPQEPVKRNLNALIPMGLSMAMIAAGVPVASQMISAQVNGLLTHTLFVLVFGGLAWVAVGNVLGKADEIVGRLEV